MRTINFYGLDLYRGDVVAAIPLEEKELRSRNDDKMDIYWTFNEFSEFGLRKKEDLKKIHAFYCEVDNVDWENIQKIFKKNAPPSLVIKTKRGFHLYWYLNTPIDCTDDPVKWADWFREFVKTRILPVFNADPQACDACRLLRAPFYKYWKDKGASDTWVDIFIDNETIKYSLKDLEKYFPKKQQQRIESPRVYAPLPTGDFWTKANSLDARYALGALSGSSMIGGEMITFKQESGITRIVVNGKPSNAWLDKNGKIGSTANAGPSVVNWLTYYNHDMKKIADILKQKFKELGE